MDKLFTEITVGDLRIKNRIVMPPMCMYQADNSGNAQDFHVTHYATRAMGGVGLIIVEATAVEPCGRISDQDLGIWSDDHIEGLKKITDQVKSYGAHIGIQLNHAGRKCGAKSEKTIYAPSPIAFSEEYLVPVEMTMDDIKRVIALFKDAAKRAKKAGFELVEIHGAHGYLLSEFMSPLANTRTDRYGGSHENRVRLAGEIIDAVKSVFDGTIGFRVSAEDYAVGGNHPSDLVQMINLVKDKGVEIVNVSSGGVAEASIPLYPGYQVKFAEEIKKGCQLPVIAGGLLTDALMLEEILCNDRADMVFLGRELLRNPYFALKAAHTLKVDIEWNTSYERARFR